MGRDLMPCGTQAAYQRHLRQGEEPCDACRAANTAYKRSRLFVPPRPLMPCGTAAAYRRHLRYGEEPCEACREAARAYDREKNKHRQPFRPAAHGSISGYQRHKNTGEPMCEPCRAARRDYMRVWRAKARAAAGSAA